MKPASVDAKRELASRVLIGGYYTDGSRLVEPVSIGATGCVTFRDCCSGYDRCLSIVDFRAGFWLVQEAAA